MSPHAAINDHSRAHASKSRAGDLTPASPHHSPAPPAAATQSSALSPQPPDSLSESDAAHLIALIDAPPQGLEALARARAITCTQLLDLLSSPAAERHLAGIARLAVIRRESQADPIRNEFVAVLRAVAAESTDPVERRRAASAGLRALDPWRSAAALLKGLGRAREALTALRDRAGAPPSRPTTPSFPTPPLPHSPTQSSVSPQASRRGDLRPQSSAPPASSLSSPEPVTAAFLDALRRDPDEALPYVAGYRIRAQSQAALRHWLLTARAMLARAGAPGPARIDDKTDTALQHITAAPDDPADPPARLVIKAVLERNARGEHRWCIADVTRAADTS